MASNDQAQFSFKRDHETADAYRRQAFNIEHRGHLPDDLYIGISNLPTKWKIVPPDEGEGDEIPDLDQDLLFEVCSSILRSRNLFDPVISAASIISALLTFYYRLETKVHSLGSIRA